METRRIGATIASLLTLAAAQADVFMQFEANKRFYQDSAQRLRFDSGELNVLLRDGLVIIDAACVVQPQLFFYPPSTIPSCPLGATGFVAAGDLDRDGIRDDNQYWSVLTVIPNFAVEPSRPELCELAAAPPSKLPRPLQNFRDDSVFTFYDISTPFVQQYDQSRYELTRRYGAVRQVETVVAQGEITTSGDLAIVVTGADIPGSPLPLTASVTEGDFPVNWAENVRLALRASPAVTSVYTVGGFGANVVLTEITPDGNDPTLNIAIDAGTAAGLEFPISSIDTTAGTPVASPAAALKQMNEEIVPGQYVFTYPRLDNPTATPVAIPVTVVPTLEAVNPASRSRRAGFRFTSGSWDGDTYQMDPRLIHTVTWQGNDRTVVRPGDEMYFSILNSAEDFITFPPTVPQTPVLIASPTATRYTMPPFFYEVGEQGVMSLEYNRDLPSNAIAYDRSTRTFRAKVKMVDSFAGYAQITAPLGTPKRDLQAKADLDRDGMINVDEFAFQFPTNEDINASAGEQFVPQPTTSPFGPAVEEFSRVISPKVAEAMVDDSVQPAGPTGPFLDPDNHIVVQFPYRPRVGTTLRYDFVEATVNKKGKVKTKKLKLNGNWTTTMTETPSVVTGVTIEYKIVDAVTRDVYDIETRAAPDVNLVQKMVVLRSVNPVNPADPLPDIRVKVTATALR